MSATCKVAFVIASLLAVSLPASSQDLSGFKVGPPKGAIIAGAVAVGAGVTVLVLYLTLRNSSIMGCTQTADGAFSLTDDKNHLNYALDDQTSGLKAGERVQLKGKKKKDKHGHLRFRVKKIKKNYGPCEQ
jgi:hypothetical protein